MKKLSSILILLCIITMVGNAQNKPVNGSGNSDRYTASAANSAFGIAISVDKNTKWIEYHNMIANQPFNNYVFLKGTKTITVFGYLPKDSLNYYSYNIIENDNKMLVEYAIPGNGATGTKIRLIKPDLVEINLGDFNVENKKLTIETFKVTGRSRVNTTTIYNKEIEPAAIGWVARGIITKNGSTAVRMERIKDGSKFKIHDTTTVTDLKVVIKPTDITFVYNVYLKNLATGQSILVSNNWLYDYFTGSDFHTALPYLTVNAALFNEPGNYELQIIPKLPGGFRVKAFPEKATTFRFTVLPSDTVYGQKTVIGGLVAIACLVLVVFYINKARNKKMLAQQKQQKDIAQLQLDAVRSQLNPHFLFNALSGIQNLMNKMEIDQANRYLTKFARLTRNVLKNSELTTLDEEKVLLDDYLQMEQLRFGFNYEILTDPSLDTLNTQIPAMLLQPFVENAVKHGVATMDGDGKIVISIIKKDAHIELSIRDNGKGFDTAKQNDGLGLQLSKKRIALLSAIYKDSPIGFDIQSGPGGTAVRITLKYWL